MAPINPHLLPSRKLADIPNTKRLLDCGDTGPINRATPRAGLSCSPPGDSLERYRVRLNRDSASHLLFEDDLLAKTGSHFSPIML
jgi:hypothetical protein